MAHQRLTLRPSVEARRQLFRGEMWFVMEDPFTNSFYRLTPAAFDLVARLRMDRTVEQSWQEALEVGPDSAPGQEEVIQLLAQLYHANLLQAESAGDTAQLFERYKKRTQRELQSRLASIMFARFPIWDPDGFLKRTLPLVRWLIGPLGALLWLGMIGLALKLAIEHWGQLTGSAGNVLAPANLPLLYVGLVFIKIMHELGHGYACRHFGGEVHTLGIMLLIFTPMPYVDATASWAFRSRWHRALVGAGGMIVELFIAAIAMVVWANTADGAIHALAYNLIFVASVSTVLFNANPLLRYDGYYIMSDLLQIPNLHTRASRMVRHLAEHKLFGLERSINPARGAGEGVFLAFYFFASAIYRVVLFAGIILFVSDHYLAVGLVMALVCGIAWIAKPVIGLVNYLAFEPRIERTRSRAMGVTVGGLAVLLLFLGLVPFPRHIRAPGVLEAQEHQQVHANVAGLVAVIERPSGSLVKKGDPLVRMENRELALQVVAARAELDQARAEKQEALQRGAPELQSRVHRFDAVTRRLERLIQQEKNLVVVAPQDGAWFAPDLDDQQNVWLPRGAQLGEMVLEDSFHLSAVISQRDAANLYSGDRHTGEVRLRGQAGIDLPVVGEQVLPANREMLPSAALGFQAGGEVATLQTDSSGRRAATPFFEVRATVAAQSGAVLRHGLSGQVRFTLASEPLLDQWARSLRQVLQSRLQ